MGKDQEVGNDQEAGASQEVEKEEEEVWEESEWERCYELSEAEEEYSDFWAGVEEEEEEPVEEAVSLLKIKPECAQVIASSDWSPGAFWWLKCVGPQQHDAWSKTT